MACSWVLGTWVEGGALGPRGAGAVMEPAGPEVPPLTWSLSQETACREPWCWEEARCVAVESHSPGV